MWCRAAALHVRTMLPEAVSRLRQPPEVRTTIIISTPIPAALLRVHLAEVLTEAHLTAVVLAEVAAVAVEAEAEEADADNKLKIL